MFEDKWQKYCEHVEKIEGGLKAAEQTMNINHLRGSFESSTTSTDT